MVKAYFENIKSNFEGTIIDIETIGDFDNRFGDSRRYKRIQPVIFGFIDSNGLSIHCAKGKASVEKLKEKISLILNDLKKPFYAFNCEFEMGTLFHSLNKKVIFERELNEGTGEPKWRAVRVLEISNYNDPFNDNGRACMEAWLRGEIDNAIAHNRSCLLKERDILLKRGFRTPNELRFIL